MKSWTITNRLGKSLVALVAAFWTIGVVATWLMIHEEVTEVFDSALQETAQRIAPLVETDPNLKCTSSQGTAIENCRLVPRQHKEQLHYQVRDRAGKVILKSHRAATEPFPIPLKHGFFDADWRRFYSEEFPAQGILIQVAEKPRERLEAIAGIALFLLSPLILLLPLAVAIVWRTVGSAMRPIRDLQNELAARNGQMLRPISSIDLPGELAPITNDVNRLLERLSKSLDAERAYSARAAHELRNPIAAARAQALVLADGFVEGDDKRRAGQIIEMLDRLSRQVEKLLQLTRAEGGVGLGGDPVDLLELIQLIVQDYEHRVGIGRQIEFRNNSVGSQMVCIDPDAIGIVVQNVIDSAITHGAPDGSILVVVEANGRVRITNDGPTIAQHQIVELVKPFHRGRSARLTSGAGLGLTIVTTIMEQAGGRVEIQSPARGRDDGFEVELFFPVSK